MADDVNNLGTSPVGTDPNNVPGDLQDLKDAINEGSILRRLTQAQIDALPGAQKKIGVHVHNLTSGRVEMWNGSAWVQSNELVISAFEVRSGTTATSWAAGSTIAQFGLASRPGGTRSARWLIRKDDSTESGSNAGSDLQIIRLADDGVSELDSAVTIRRSDGRVLLSRETEPGDPSATVVTKGFVVSADRVVAGRWSGTTAIDGQVSIGLPSPPSGMTWSFVPVGVYPLVASVVSVSATVAVVQTNVNSTAGAFHWHAIAY